MDWSLTVKQRAIDLGFDLVGIAPVTVSNDHDFSRLWVEIGLNGQMAYLENPKRFDPRLVLPSAKSAICVGWSTMHHFHIQPRGAKS